MNSSSPPADGRQNRFPVRPLLDRRSFVTNLVAGLTVHGSGQTAAVSTVPAGAIDVTAAFGFVGDGRTDNYAAFHRLVAHANRTGGGSYNFPPGIFFVARFENVPATGLPLSDAVPAPFVGCDGLTIIGYGAKVVLNGRFNRRAGAIFRDTIFMPFEFRRCRNVRLAGFEVDGGVRNMTRDRNAAETYASLVSLLGCSQVSLEDLDLHHGQTDGVYLYLEQRQNRPGLACRDIRLRNVSCHHNARGGLAPLQVAGLLAVDCSFSNNGTSDLGRYGAHAPGFGVDVEPDFFKPSDVDVRTGDLEFRGCRFEDNVAGFHAAYLPRYQGYLRIIDCSSTNRHSHPYHMILSWRGALLEGGVHDAGEGTIYSGWQEVGGSDVALRNCEIRTSGFYGVLHGYADHRLTIDGVKIIGMHRKAAPHGFVLLVQGAPPAGQRHVVRNCEVFVPAARKSEAHKYDYEVSLHYSLAENNLYRTDLPVEGGRHFCTEYADGTVVRGDRYRGRSPGPADSFRPGHNSSHDTRQPFSLG